MAIRRRIAPRETFYENIPATMGKEADKLTTCETIIANTVQEVDQLPDNCNLQIQIYVPLGSWA